MAIPRRLGPKNSRSQVDGLETCCLSLKGLFMGKTSLGTDEDQNLGRMGHGFIRLPAFSFSQRRIFVVLLIEGEHFFEGIKRMNFGNGSPAALFRRFLLCSSPIPAASGLPSPHRGTTWDQRERNHLRHLEFR